MTDNLNHNHQNNSDGDEHNYKEFQKSRSSEYFKRFINRRESKNIFLILFGIVEFLVVLGSIAFLFKIIKDSSYFGIFGDVIGTTQILIMLAVFAAIFFYVALFFLLCSIAFKTSKLLKVNQQILSYLELNFEETLRNRASLRNNEVYKERVRAVAEYLDENPRD